MSEATRTDIPRVVSLIASATEVVCALGAGHLLVARSHECDWPPAVERLPSLTRARFPTSVPGRDIDRSVKALIERGLAVYEVDAQGLRRARPDVILTQDQCEVCAVSLADVERAVASWVDCRANVVSLRPHTLTDICRDNERIAAALGRPEAGATLNAAMRRRLDAIASRVTGLSRPRLAFIEWIDPLMSCGHWMPELVATAGAINLFGETGAASPWISMTDLAAADPDVILVAPCGYPIERSRREMPLLDRDPAWRGLRAVATGNVYIADGNAYFNRPGPRLVESAEIIAEILHPAAMPRKHLGAGVRRHVPGNG